MVSSATTSCLQAEIAEGNVSLFVRSYVEQNERRMTKSLRLLVNHMIAVDKKQSNVTEIDEEGL